MTARVQAIGAIAVALSECEFECDTNEQVWFDSHKNAEYIFERLIASGFDITRPGMIQVPAS